MTATAILNGNGNSGVYKILCTGNNKIYIGSSANLKKRKRDHWRFLGRGEHPNSHMQHAWVKYGGGSFSFEVQVFCDKGALLVLEQKLIDESNSAVVGFNMAKHVTAPMRGRKFSAESRAKLSRSHKGKVFSEETITALKSAAISNREQTSRNATRMWAERSAEQKSAISAKIAERNTGRKRSPDVLEKFKQAALALWQTDGHKAKMLLAHSTRKDFAWSDAGKKSHGEKVTAYQNSEEARAARSALHTGRKCSPETKAKMSESARLRETKKREARI